jgi:hypothetical protein
MHRVLVLAAALIAGAPAFAATSDYLLTIEELGRAAPGGQMFLKVSSTGDLDGDGLPDEAVLRISCTSGKVAAAHLYVLEPSHSAAAQASGKRMHRPFTIVKEWSPASPQLAKMRPTYDVKEQKGARAVDADGWIPVSLSNAPDICPVAQQAVVKSKSNITNN